MDEKSIGPKIDYSSVNLDGVKIGRRSLEIVTYLFENPSLSHTDIAKHFGITRPRVTSVLNHPRVLEAFPILARRRMQGMVPTAVKRFDQLLKQDANLEVSRKVSERVLETGKVLENNQNITVTHKYEQLPVEKLAEIISQTKIQQQNVVDAEVISEKDHPA